ncbi:MAG TPA: hypothetical protein VF304_18020 [Casimicrobiaceae bacterium]
MAHNNAQARNRCAARRRGNREIGAARLSRANFEVRKRPLSTRVVRMDLDRKATGRGGDEAKRRDTTRRNVAFDVVTVKMDLHQLVRSQAEHDAIVLENRQDLRLRGRHGVVNGEIEDAIFGESLAGHQQEYGDQEGVRAARGHWTEYTSPQFSWPHGANRQVVEVNRAVSRTFEFLRKRSKTCAFCKKSCTGRTRARRD